MVGDTRNGEARMDSELAPIKHQAKKGIPLFGRERDISQAYGTVSVSQRSQRRSRFLILWRFATIHDELQFD
jgi:hypothetical protein